MRSSVLHDPGLDALFHPKSVAILGASGRPNNPFGRPLAYLHRYGFAGPVYPVNPNYAELEGVPCYPSLLDVETPVDLAMLLLPAALTLQALEDCAQVGTKAAIICASGFSETGDAGRKVQDEIVRSARAKGIRLLGPNCQGVVYASTQLVASFTTAVEPGILPADGLAYIGQSGAVGGSVFDLAREAGVGLTAWASTGNQCDLDLIEIGNYLLDDPDVHILMLYLESLNGGRRYIELARHARELGKPIVLLRSGRSTSGQRAVVSHTGAMVAGDAAMDLVSAQEGVVVVQDTDELIRVGVSLRRTPVCSGNRLAIVTTSGGAGGLAADLLDTHGLVVDTLSVDTQTKLARLIPSFGAVANPVDVTGQLFGREDREFREVCLIAGRDPDIDVVMVVLTMLIGELGISVAHELREVPELLGKPLLVAWIAGKEQTREARDILDASKILVFDSVGEAAQAAAAVSRWGQTARTPASTAEISDARTRIDPLALASAVTAELITEYEGRAVLDAIGVPHGGAVLAVTASEALQATQRFGCLTAMKVHAPTLVHKTEVGGVRLTVEPEDGAAAYVELMANVAASGSDVEVFGVTIQPMAAPGIEMIVGVTRSPNDFPAILTVGFGGVAAELDRDISSRLVPIDRGSAVEMLAELRGGPLLRGYRGARAADMDALVHAIVGLSEAAAQLEGTLEELEINPLLVHEAGEGITAVDFMMRTTAAPL
jgi:acetate---CoA ligase (ADP-forming)